jgi:glutaminyl-tRNA synthetase
MHGTMTEPPTSAAGRDFIRDLIDRDRAAGRHGGRVATRFPPEPNGYLHIGHAKSICLNFGLAQEYGGTCNLRLDDTNPETEDQEFVIAIQDGVRWLGFDWGQNFFRASDHFERFYELAVELIRRGKAYICSLSEDEIRDYRGTLTEPGRDSPYRERSVAENLDLFARMRAGEFADGEHVLRGKIDMASPNMKMRDPLFYRIKHAAHYHRGNAWCIYPLYDFAHPLSDVIEGITHSLCTLEFENNRAIYDWLVDTLGFPDPPRQTEFARLNLTYTVMSKRKLLELVERKRVAGWDDPRLPTLAGLRRRGFTPAALRDFCERIGVAKANSTVDAALLDHCQREDLNPQVPRVMCVLRPLKLVIENYPEGMVEELEAPYYPHDVPKEGSRKVPFSRVLHIERDDFAEQPPKGFHRLSPGREVRLRYAYLVRCESVVKDPATGEPVEVRCTYDPATRGGSAPDGRRVPGTLHWVSAAHALPVEVRIYDRLFRVERPDLEEPEAGFEAALNPDSLQVLAGCRIEPAAVDPALGERLQFERQGYFFRDPVDAVAGRLAFNRIVPLRDSWAREAAKTPPGPPPPRPEAGGPSAPPGKAQPACGPRGPDSRGPGPNPIEPKALESKAPIALSEAELEQLECLRPALLPVVRRVMAAHTVEVERYRSGKAGLLGFFVAQVMKQVQPDAAQVNPKLINAMLVRELSAG